MNTKEQAVRIGDHANTLASELADRFDISRKAIVEAAIEAYYATNAAAKELNIRRMVKEERADYTTKKQPVGK